MIVITNLGVSCDLGTSPAAVCSPVVPPVVGAVTWSFLHSHCLRRKREDKRAHTELSSHPGVERVYKGQNTNGSSVSVATSSAEELRHFCRIVQEEWLDRMLEDQLQSRGLHLPGGETEYEGELIPGGDRHDIVTEVTPLLALLDWYFRLLFNLIQSYSIQCLIVLNSWMYDVCFPSYCFY